MLHLTFARPSKLLEIFHPDGSSYSVTASGDAWGEKYGTDGPIAPGHYMLPGSVERFDFIPSEGVGQIDVADLDDLHFHELVAAKLTTIFGDQIEIGGVILSCGGLARRKMSREQRDRLFGHR